MDRALGAWAGRYPGPHAVLIGNLPRSIYETLLSSGWVRTGPVPGYSWFPEETVFSPKSFEILNSYIEWVVIPMK